MMDDGRPMGPTDPEALWRKLTPPPRPRPDAALGTDGNLRRAVRKLGATRAHLERTLYHTAIAADRARNAAEKLDRAMRAALGRIRRIEKQARRAKQAKRDRKASAHRRGSGRGPKR